jgi:hypothetical protein
VDHAVRVRNLAERDRRRHRTDGDDENRHSQSSPTVPHDTPSRAELIALLEGFADHPPE